MKHSKSKKTLLGLATTLLPTATTMLVSGKHIEGGILAALAAGLFIAYDVLDDRAKGQPSVPEGIDEKTFEELAKVGAEAAEKAVDAYEDSQSSD